MKKMTTILLSTTIVLFTASICLAHFGMVIPTDSMVMQEDFRTITLTLSFSHPFEGQGMELEMPKKFTLATHGKTYDLTTTLTSTKVWDHTAWKTDYQIKRPGIYQFCLEPQPYWEPAEDCFIIHYTKTVVAAFGDDEGWDAELGLKTEIVPLSKPFGLYTGNIFQGIVKMDGKPVPYAEVEIEFYNQDGKALAPSDYMVTQTIKADQNGVFTYAVPRAGWWGFAALNTAAETLVHDGQEKAIELGAVIWVEFHDWQEKP
ncbi:MAG: DUF4198 domain-containing protein [Deltaproteobacteria bacterium]|nr:DUF4198 domain-containing protein [Candidatus Anaeroferrophillus wilburensis]MBN2888259.1 DUF4198 domain-containing protein [Deltaproteobacteria bacterium]